MMRSCIHCLSIPRLSLENAHFNDRQYTDSASTLPGFQDIWCSQHQTPKLCRHRSARPFNSHLSVGVPRSQASLTAAHTFLPIPEHDIQSTTPLLPDLLLILWILPQISLGSRNLRLLGVRPSTYRCRSETKPPMLVPAVFPLSRDVGMMARCLGRIDLGNVPRSLQ